MQFHQEIAEQLLTLTADAGTPGGTLADGLDRLLADGLHAVPSLLGVSLTVTRHDQPITVGAQTSATPVSARSSLRLRLPGRTDAILTLHAAEPGALDQLGADLPALLDVHRERAVLDQHLARPTHAPTILARELRDTTTVDRALGVLLDFGILAEDGLTELRRRAGDNGTSVAAAASHILARVTPPAKPPRP